MTTSYPKTSSGSCGLSPCFSNRLARSKSISVVLSTSTLPKYSHFGFIEFNIDCELGPNWQGPTTCLGALPSLANLEQCEDSHLVWAFGPLVPHWYSWVPPIDGPVSKDGPASKDGPSSFWTDPEISKQFPFTFLLSLIRLALLFQLLVTLIASMGTSLAATADPSSPGFLLAMLLSQIHVLSSHLLSLPLQNSASSLQISHDNPLLPWRFVSTPYVVSLLPTSNHLKLWPS